MSPARTAPGAARLDGLFGVKLPVRDLATSRAWYERVFDLELLFEFPDDDGTVRGVVYEAAGLGQSLLALRERPDIAGLSGFDPVAFAVTDKDALDAWSRKLDAFGVAHTVRHVRIGWLLLFHDPDGMEIHFYTRAEGGLRQN